MPVGCVRESFLSIPQYLAVQSVPVYFPSHRLQQERFSLTELAVTRTGNITPYLQMRQRLATNIRGSGVTVFLCFEK